MNDNEYKNCPYCGEEIKAIAIKCKHCQSFLDKETGPVINEEQQKPETDQLVGQAVDKKADLGSTLTKTGTSLMTIGCLLTLFVTIPIIFILFLGGC
jgi:hypothetical protein